MDKNFTCKDISSLDALENLSFINALAEAKYEANTPITAISLDYDEAIHSNKEFFSLITGYNKRIVDRLINQFMNITEFKNENNGKVYRKNNRISKIVVPEFVNSFASSVAVHEYTHVMDFDFIKSLTTDYSQMEILPLTNQLIYTKEINEDGEFNKSFEKYVIHQQLFYNLKKFVMINEILDSSDFEYDRDELLSQLLVHYKYFIGSLYSLILYDFYKYDKKIFVKESKKLYQNNHSVQDLIDYYGVTLEDRESVGIIKSLVK